jgi:dihydroneopterin aldolase
MTVHINNLKIKAIIGILDFEREKAQDLFVDLEATYRYKHNSFLNYADMVTIITDDITTKKYGLLEDALIGLKDILIAKYPQITTLNIKLTKPDIIKSCQVGLSKTWNF